MGLTTLQCARAKPRIRAYKLYDGGGLFLLVMPNGGRYWRYKYRAGGKEKALALGTHANVSLAQARVARNDAFKLLQGGIDPSAQRQSEKQAQRAAEHVAAEDSFEVVAREWHENEKPEWTERHAGYVLRRMQAGLFPVLGSRPIAEITPQELLAALRRIEAKGTKTVARRCWQCAQAVFGFALASGLAERNPAADLKKALAKRPPEQHYVAVPLKALPDLVQAINGYSGAPLTRLAVQLLLHTAVRTNELINARWDELDTDTWTIPGTRMKMRTTHVVPLSQQALAIIAQVRQLTGDSDRVFPRMSNNAPNDALHDLGYKGKQTGHGLRSLFSTACNEVGHFRVDVIEASLAHKEADAARGAYNRAQYVAERRAVMQWWSDFLEGRNVVPIQRKVRARG